MSFQKQVNILPAYGVPGEIALAGPQRVDVLTMNSNFTTTGHYNTIGYAFTKNVLTNIASVGGEITAGTTTFAGILISPKEYASRGNLSSGLAPTMNLPDNSTGQFLTMGTIFVTVIGNADQSNPVAKIGDIVLYNLSAANIPVGALSCLTSGTTIPTGWAQVPNAKVRDIGTTNAGVIIIELTN